MTLSSNAYNYNDISTELHLLSPSSIHSKDIYSIHQELKSSAFLFAVIVSFAQSEYEIEESSESAPRDRRTLIEVLARGNLSESNFNIPVTVTGGTATGRYDVGCYIYYFLYIKL